MVGSFGPPGASGRGDRGVSLANGMPGGNGWEQPALGSRLEPGTVGGPEGPSELDRTAGLAAATPVQVCVCVGGGGWLQVQGPGRRNSFSRDPCRYLGGQVAGGNIIQRSR